jgi:hypothetical protein
MYFGKPFNTLIKLHYDALMFCINLFFTLLHLKFCCTMYVEMASKRKPKNSSSSRSMRISAPPVQISVAYDDDET